MLKRKVYYQLLQWKEKQAKKCLIISGARQVGKTTIVREFSKNYTSFIELNFLESPSLKSIFSGDLDVETLIANLSFAIKNVAFIPSDTLILLDEAQECPNAITSLKFWSLDGRFDVIATGSALGLNYNVPTSYPVGYVEYLDMFSMDFEEFLWANAVTDQQIALLKSHFIQRKPLPSFLHEKMMEYLRYYMVIGGMPEVVNTYTQTHNLFAADQIQRTIYRDYLFDIARFANSDVKIKAENCYKSIPLQLSKENHKFQYKIVEHKGTARKFESSLDWLENAHFIKLIYNVSTLAYPLESFSIRENFRIYPKDIGLLICYYDFELKKAILEDKKIDTLPESLILKTSKGGLYEALAADFLIKRGTEHLFFYKQTGSTLEIEFLLSTPEGIIPIEIKAGRSKTNSLDVILNDANIPFGYKMADQNIGIHGKKITMPLYMLMFI